jgi:RimJ/RimL family protein N-acetyltransferase
VVLPIETERLTLRRFEESDVSAIVWLSADPEVHAAAGELGSTEAAARTYVRVQQALEEFERGALFDVAIVVRDGARLIGMATLVLGESSAEVGYALHSEGRRHGYATEAASALVRVAFEELGVDEVQAQVGPENSASRAVLERVGMRVVEGERITTREAGDIAYAIARADWEQQHGQAGEA